MFQGSSLRKYIFFILIILVPAGFLTKWQSLHNSAWISNSLGGILYVMFFILVVKFINPKWKSFIISILVVLFTSSLEFTQLLKTPFLETIRSTFIGRTLIGNSFNTSDFLYYIIGGILGFLLLAAMNRRTT